MQNQQRQKQQTNKIWEGDTVLCIASGPSIDTDDIDYARGKCRVIVINDNYQLASWADLLYACDLKWWDWHKGVPDFEGMKYTMDKVAAKKYDLDYVKGEAGEGLNTSHIHTGSNSGFQAINLAYLFGAKRILLTGYDMHVNKNGASHWFGNHPDLIISNYQRWIKGFDQVAKQNLVEIINCTRDTSLKCFPQMRLQDAL